jgi:hypothetical protein
VTRRSAIAAIEMLRDIERLDDVRSLTTRLAAGDSTG